MEKQVASKKIKKHWTLSAIFGRIADFIVYPIIIISFVSSFFMLVSKSQNLISPIFGNYFVRILSGSMTNSGFKKGDVVLVKQTDAKSLRVGDIIAFYHYYDQADGTEKVSLYNQVFNQDGKLLVSVEGKSGEYPNFEVDANGVPIYNQELYNNTPKSTNENWTSVQDAVDSKASIWFHEIIDIRVDVTNGALFFLTKGSSNGSNDSFMIREEFVVGRYSYTSSFVREVIAFCASSTGMLLIVVLPISIVVLFELLSVLEQINNIMLEKKVIKRQIRFKSPETMKANIGIEMRESDRAYLYDVMNPKYKQELYEFLWGWQKDVVTSKNQKSYNNSVIAVDKYDFDNPTAYWQTFIDSEKSKRKKKIFEQMEKEAKLTKFDNTLIEDYQNVKNGFNEVDEFIEQSGIIKNKKQNEYLPPKKPYSNSKVEVISALNNVNETNDKVIGNSEDIQKQLDEIMAKADLKHKNLKKNSKHDDD